MRPSDASSLNKDNIPPSSFPFHVSQCSLIPISGASASGTAFIIFPSLTAEFFPPLLSHFILPKGSVLPFISWHFTSVDGNDTNGMWLRLYHRNAVCPAQANLQIIPQERNTPWMQVWELQKKKKANKKHRRQEDEVLMMYRSLPGCYSCHGHGFLPESYASKIAVKDGGCCSGSFGVASASKQQGLLRWRLVSPNLSNQGYRAAAFCFSWVWKPVCDYWGESTTASLLFSMLTRLWCPSAHWEGNDSNCKEPLGTILVSCLLAASSSKPKDITITKLWQR